MRNKFLGQNFTLDTHKSDQKNQIMSKGYPLQSMVQTGPIRKKEVASSSEGNNKKLAKHRKVRRSSSKSKTSSKEKNKSKLEKQCKEVKKKQLDDRGIIYVGRIPHGFYEKQMRAYFSQFGKVLRLKISRNRKTGASRHFGFVEFESTEHAKIAAETMNDYLLYGHILKCNLVPKNKIPTTAFSKRRINFTSKSFDLNYERSFNKKAEVLTIQKKLEKRLEKQNKKKVVLEKLGIKYEFPDTSNVTRMECNNFQIEQ